MQKLKNRRLQSIDIDPPGDFCDCLGEIVLRWTRLEFQLGVIIRVITKNSKAKQRELLYNKRTTELCQILHVVSGIVGDAPLVGELSTFMDAVDKLNDRRNGYVHSLYGHWSGDRDAPVRFRMKKTTGAEPLHDKASVAELMSFAAEVRALQVTAQDLTTRLKRIYGTRA